MDPILTAKKLYTPSSLFEMKLAGKLSQLNLKGDFVSDPADLNKAAIFCDGVIKLITADPKLKFLGKVEVERDNTSVNVIVHFHNGKVRKFYTFSLIEPKEHQESRLDKVKSTFGKYNYNEHKICLNPDVALIRNGKVFQYKIEVAETKSGWTNSHSCNIDTILTGGGYNGSSCSLSGEIFSSRDHAILDAAESAYKFYQEKMREVKQFRKHAIDLQPLALLIGKLKEKISPTPKEMQPAEPVVRYSDAELDEFNNIIMMKLTAAKKELQYLDGWLEKNRGVGSIDDEIKQMEAMRERQVQFIDKLNEALHRIEIKTYGICRLTGKLIDKARLRAVPHATLSAEAKGETLPVQLTIDNPNNLNMEKQQEFKRILLDNIISSSTNHLQRDPWELEPKALAGLASSIAKDEVIQPILVRPAKGKPGKFELVAGERRWVASGIANKKDIPAYIRDLSDQQVTELQIIENLQRENPHPVKEGQAYKAYQETHDSKITLKEMSARFGKSEDYIAARLSFNNLIPEMRKAFMEGKMLIGHAILFARLQPADQKKCMEDCVGIGLGTPKGLFNPIHECRDHIQSEFVLALKQAPFDVNDEKLVPSAGSCNACPKRSGANPSLFADIKETDRCFDPKCYRGKCSASTLLALAELLASNPDMPIVKGYRNEIDPAVQKMLDKNSIKPLGMQHHYHDSEKGEKGAIRSLLVAGNNAGKFVWIKPIKKEAAKPAHEKKPSNALKLQQLESDLEALRNSHNEQICSQATDRLFDIKPYTQEDDTPLTATEVALLLEWILYEAGGSKTYNHINASLKKLKPAKMKEGSPGFAIERLKLAPTGLVNLIYRNAVREYLEGWGGDEDTQATIRKLAGEFKGVNIEKIEQDVNASFHKQEQILKDQIKALKAPAAKATGVKALVKK